MGHYVLSSGPTGEKRQHICNFCVVLVFDVTYKTNEFRMPFALFTGVNHHFQSSLFGGSSLEAETTDTYVWPFSQFQRCMFNRPPAIIITDQDAAICNAVGTGEPTSILYLAC